MELAGRGVHIHVQKHPSGKGRARGVPDKARGQLSSCCLFKVEIRSLGNPNANVVFQVMVKVYFSG